MNDTNPDFIALSRERLRQHEARRIAAPDAMPAAVLLLLSRRGADVCVVLTVRSFEVEHHKGEISFPGGAVHEADDSRETTALRETWEEIGVKPDDVEIIGRLDENITISNFVVTPFVGVLKPSPYEFVAQASEVGEIIEPPIAHLLNPNNFAWEERASASGSPSRMAAYTYNGHRIWGATARMLRSYLQLLEPSTE